MRILHCTTGSQNQQVLSTGSDVFLSSVPKYDSEFSELPPTLHAELLYTHVLGNSIVEEKSIEPTTKTEEAANSNDGKHIDTDEEEEKVNTIDNSCDKDDEVTDNTDDVAAPSPTNDG